MKTILFAAAAALALGGAGYAQTTTEAEVETETETSTTATTTQTGATVAAGNAAPELDARGIPVVSDPAAAPAGANEAVQAPAGSPVIPAANQSAVFATKASTETYPPCTREVTDGCVQAYERGRAPE